ncbi:MAG: patatin-like phospholipase family protein [Nitrospiria bacterium]
MGEKIAVVLCGGGSKGAIEVGFYQALVESGVKIDLIVGSSIGAVNGAFMASGISYQDLALLWKNMRIQDLYGFNWNNLWKFFGADSLYDHSRFRRFLERHLSVFEFNQLKIPLIVTCTNLQTGQPVYIRKGNLPDALMASVAVPGLFPPQRYQGSQLVDGSVSDNVPLDIAVFEGATTILCMQYNCCGNTPRPVRGLKRILGRAFSIALDQKTASDIRYYRDKAKLIVLEPTFGLDIEILDFRYTALLINRSYTFSKKALEREFRLLPQN